MTAPSPYLARVDGVTATGHIRVLRVDHISPHEYIELARVALWPTEGPLRPAGLLSRAFLRSLLTQRLVGICESSEGTGHEVTLDEENVSDCLVAAGHARYSDH